MRPAIRIEGLSKRYRLGELGRHHWTLGESLAGLFRRQGSNGRASGRPDEIWAIKDVSLEVEPGEVVGIIGRNGAGKSTLLKILSRITEPTEGAVDLRGRVSSLLEVGTGFHPELTGRENIYLNGSILGMRKAEIDRKFDEIVGFAGVERFLDTPVKRYSSGMQVRLAFAVAAHLEPEILIVDEVLAVGDAEFQRKCLGKMGEVAGGGRTVLFVSHNMAAVESLCSRSIVLDEGAILFDGDVPRALQHYSRLARHVPAESCRGRLISFMEVRGEADRPSLVTGEAAEVSVRISPDRPIVGARLTLSVRDLVGRRICVFENTYQHGAAMNLAHECCIRVRLPNFRLSPGEYLLEAVLRSGSEVLEALPAIPITVEAADLYGTGKLPPAKGGPYLPEVVWQW